MTARGHIARRPSDRGTAWWPRYLASGPGTWPDRVEGSSPLLYGPRGRPTSPSAIGSNFADIAPDRSGPGTGAGLDDLSRRRLPPVPPRRISRRCRGPGPDGLDRWAYRPDADRGPAGTGPQRQSVRNGRGDAAPPGRGRRSERVQPGPIAGRSPVGRACDGATGSADDSGSVRIGPGRDGSAPPREPRIRYAPYALAGAGFAAGAAGLEAPRAFWSRWSFFLATLLRSVTSSALFQASGCVLA